MAQRLSDLETIDAIKKIIIGSLASDDQFLEMLVLKGGNAISLGYGLSDRPSYDLDYSLVEDFEDLKDVSDRMEQLLQDGFRVKGYVCFDFKLIERPKVDPIKLDFWGGYEATFKIIPEALFRKINYDFKEARSKYALRLNPSGSPIFNIDFSKFEYIENHKVSKEIDGIQLYIYSPELIVAEKVRALCQKLPEYTTDVLNKKKPDHERARARDFYDIDIITSNFPFDEKRAEFLDILREVFDAKHVPYHYIKRIRDMREVHRQDFESVKATISDKEVDEKGFDFYFDSFINKFENIFD